MSDPCQEFLDFLVTTYGKAAVDSFNKHTAKLIVPFTFSISFPNLIGNAETYLATKLSSVGSNGITSRILKFIVRVDKVIIEIENLRCNPSLTQASLNLSLPQIPLPSVTFQVAPTSVPGLTSIK